MANVKNAKKKIIQIRKTTLAHQQLKSTVKNAIKETDKAVLAGNKSLADKSLKKAIKALDNAKVKGLVHKNKVDREKSRLTKKGYTDREVQILAPMYKSLNGIDNLNIMLQELFNPSSKNKKEINIRNVTFRECDKVLQLVNDPDNNVYNGDIGYIEDIIISKDKKIINQININYDGNIVEYTPDKFINFRHGYAISIHKAQGSEFDMVIMPVVNSFKRMLYNKLVYTGVTRAKKSLVIVGDSNAFIYGINNDYVDNRKTTLKDFIINFYNEIIINRCKNLRN